MSSGRDITFRVLRETRNLAATPWLVAALDSADEAQRLVALDALLHRPAEHGREEVIQRWDRLGDAAREWAGRFSHRLAHAIRDGILSSDGEFNRQACAAAISFKDYDQIPTLIRAAEDHSNACAELAARSVVTLADELFTELTTPRDYRNRRDPALIRQYVYGEFEETVRRFGRHRRDALVEAFLILAAKSDSLLRHLLTESSDPAYGACIGQLTQSTRPGVMRLVWELLGDSPVPPSIVHVFARRKDLPFLKFTFGQPFEKHTPPFLQNLRRVETWAWLRDDLSLLSQFSDKELAGAVRLVCASGANRLRAFDVVRYALREGGLLSRREAATCLEEFKGSEANELLLFALTQPDPETQVAAVRQLRQRGIPGGLPRLIELLSSPHEIVRVAVQEQLSEFTFSRFLTAFEMLDKQTRIATGPLVKQIDPEAIDRLRTELSSLSRSRRLRGIELAIAMQAANEVEEQLLEISCDTDHFLRTASVDALISVRSERAANRLQEMRLDRAVSVQEATELALDRMRAVPDPFASLT